MTYKSKEQRRECCRKWAAAWRARNPGRAAFHRRKFYLATRDERLIVERRRRIRQYGMTLEEYDQKKSLYPVCPICEKRKVNALDHNHATGQLRDFLCTQCNVNLHAIENKEYLSKALKYLSDWERKAACIDPRVKEKTVFCPKVKRDVENVGSRVLQLRAEPTYIDRSMAHG